MRHCMNRLSSTCGTCIRLLLPLVIESSSGCAQFLHIYLGNFVPIIRNYLSNQAFPSPIAHPQLHLYQPATMTFASAGSSDPPPSLASETTTPTTNVKTADDDVLASVTRKQRITIVGAGAVGSYYGARLWEVGHIVIFNMRGEHHRVVQQDGLTITSVHGNIRIPADKLLTVNDTSAVTEPVDWVIVALKSSSLDAVPDLIYPMLTPHTRVLVIMNGIMIEEELIQMLKERACQTDMDAPLQCCQALYGGIGLLGSIRVAPGKIDHSFGGMIAGGVASSLSDNPEKDQAAFEQLWVGTPVEAIFEPCLLRGRWTKMVGNLSTNGISVAMGGITVDQIMSDPDLRRLAEQIMDEAISIANADLEREYGAGGFVPLGEAEKNRVLFVAGKMGGYKTSTTNDFLERRPMEVKYLFRKPVERALELGVPAPHLETLVAQIGAFQRMYNLF